jgi:hypothetical protein
VNYELTLTHFLRGNAIQLELKRPLPTQRFRTTSSSGRTSMMTTSLALYKERSGNTDSLESGKWIIGQVIRIVFPGYRPVRPVAMTAAPMMTKSFAVYKKRSAITDSLESGKWMGQVIRIVFPRPVRPVAMTAALEIHSSVSFSSSFSRRCAVFARRLRGLVL